MVLCNCHCLLLNPIHKCTRILMYEGLPVSIYALHCHKEHSTFSSIQYALVLYNVVVRQAQTSFLRSERENQRMSMRIDLGLEFL